MTMTMGRESSPPPFCWFRLFFVGNIFLAVLICVRDVATLEMTAAEKKLLKEEAREMFYHAYHAYMNHAYPADELMPLSCKGRYRDSEPSRGDIDDALGNFSLTLVDAMDTLVILGDLEGFESAVRLVVNDVTFDHDIVVSVFETNIRMLGGLLSGHILAGYLRDKLGRMPWYKGELLDMAKDLGYRLLPAFNTSTGVPHPRINLQYGLKSPKMGSSRETCTACAGTMILEFAALSRLTGEPIFEEKTHRAMDYLWQLRHRASGLMGTVLNIHNGDWVRRDSGVGAGIDSYYEYLLKAYILLGDDTYLDRFNKHYSAIMKYISQGPLLVDVHMHRPHTNTKNFMDALLAFWPGLQVLKGDIKPAIETHEMLYQVMQRHNFLPEAFTTDFKVHWGQHPLRPEFLESTYFLYKATGDSYYLDVGKSVLNSLQKFARVPCGFAAVKDVRTGSHEDRMDSFVLAETFKYLFLLFAEDEDLVINIDDFLFTTEAHLFPLTLAKLSNTTSVVRPILLKMSDDDDQDEFEANYDHTCPNTEYLFPGKKDFAHSIRLPLKNLVDGVCPKQRQSNRQLRATEFQAGNEDHLRLLRKMGISIMALPDGRVQLQHTTAHAESSEDAEEGLLFMQEMIELSKSQEHQLSQQPRAVHFVARLPDGTSRFTVLEAGPAQFGPELNAASQVTALVALASPLRACKELKNAEALRNKVGVVERGDCMFVDKARQLQKAGAVAGIVIDNTSGTSSSKSPIFAMSGDGSNDVHIPMVFLFSQDAAILLDAMASDPHLSIKLTESAEGQSAESPMERVTTPETTNTDSGSLDVGYVRVDGDGRLHSEVSDSVTEFDVVNEETDKRVEVSDDGRPKGPETVSKEREPSETPRSKSEKDDDDDVRREATVDPLVSLALLKNLKRFFDSGPISSVISVLNRETEHVKTLQSLIQTVLGDNKGMDTETKLLLDQVGEIIRLSGGVQSLSSTAEESGDDDVDGRIKTDVNNNDVADVSVEGESKPRTSSDVLQRNDNNDRDPEQSGAGPGAKRSMVNDEL